MPCIRSCTLSQPEDQVCSFLILVLEYQHTLSLRRRPETALALLQLLSRWGHTNRGRLDEESSFAARVNPRASGTMVEECWVKLRKTAAKLEENWLHRTSGRRAHRRRRCACMMRLQDCSAFRACAEAIHSTCVVICVLMCCMSSLPDVWLAVGMFVLSPVRRCVCVCVGRWFRLVGLHDV